MILTISFAPERPDPGGERRRLQAALCRLCAERGYPNFSPADLCRRAGLGEGDLRRHYPDLDACFTATVAEGTRRLVLAVAAAFSAERGWQNQLRACAWALLDFLRADLDWARLMVSEVHAAPEPARQAREQGMAALASLLDLARAELPDPERLPAHTAELTAGAIYARIHAAVETDGLAEGERLVPELLYLAARPYFGAELARRELAIHRPA
jgi:AcrR family transcriptional regulator